MKKIILFAVLLVLGVSSYAQVGVGTATPSDRAMLDVVSTEKGFLPPRMTLAELLTLSGVLTTANSPDDKGMIVYEIDSNAMVMWNGTEWVLLSPASESKFRTVLSGPSNTVTTNQTATYGESIPGTYVKDATSTSEFLHSNVSAGIVYTGSTKQFLVEVNLSYYRETNTNSDRIFTFQLVKEYLGGTKDVVTNSQMISSKTVVVAGQNEHVTNVTFSGVVELQNTNGLTVNVLGDGVATDIKVQNLTFTIREW